MKKLLSILLVVLLLAGVPVAFAQEEGVPDAFAQAVAALAGVNYYYELPYPNDAPVTNDYAIKYLSLVANNSFADRAATYEQLESPYISFTEDEMAELLTMAFDTRFGVAELVPDGTLLIYNAHAYYVRQEEDPRLTAVYEGEPFPIMEAPTAVEKPEKMVQMTCTITDWDDAGKEQVHTYYGVFTYLPTDFPSMMGLQTLTFEEVAPAC
ncbi:MAG: hypothetical protein RSC90_02605 [Clostridia bacterium]